MNERPCRVDDCGETPRVGNVLSLRLVTGRERMDRTMKGEGVGDRKPDYVSRGKPKLILTVPLLIQPTVIALGSLELPLLMAVTGAEIADDANGPPRCLSRLPVPCRFLFSSSSASL